MDRSVNTILVSGATGLQGGAVARRLLADGWRVRALTRDPGKPAAVTLAEAGVELVKGNMDDAASLAAAMDGVHGVFSVQAAFGSDLPPDFARDDEIRWGHNVAEAAKAADVAMFVHTSAYGADKPSGVPLLEAKASVERRIWELELPATVIRPTSFMENFARHGVAVRDGKLKSFLEPHVRQQLIAVDDIAAFAALAFAEPERLRGRSLVLAGDDLTSPEIADAISAALGREVPYEQISLDTLRERGEDVVRSLEWLSERKMTLADISALREIHPGLMDFRTWLARGGAELLDRYLTAEGA